MKLPQVQYRQVQSFGRHSINAVGNVINAVAQKGRVMQQAMESIAGVTADYIERQENAEYNDQVASMSIELSEWQSRHNAKNFYTSEEVSGVSEEIVPRVRTYTDDDGTQVTEFRDSIPAYEVYPHLLRQKLEGMISDKASKISNPILRDEFVQKAGVEAAERIMAATVAAEEAQKSYQLEVGMDKANEAAQSGNLELARFLIEQLETDDLTKKNLLAEAEAVVEGYHVTQAIRSSNIETVLEYRSLYSDPQYSGSLSEAQRQQAVSDLHQRAVFLTAERTKEMAMAHDAYISDANAGIDVGAYTLQDVERDYARWLRNDTDPRSVTPQERTALRARILARNARMKNQLDLVTIGTGLIDNGGDPKDSTHQKAIDAYVADKEVTDPRELERITIRSNIMPQILENFLNIAGLHDAEKGGENIPTAVELYGRLSDMKPAVLAELGKESKNVLADTHLLVRGGMSVMDAYALSRENARIKPELREQRDRDYLALDALKDNPAALSDLMDDDSTFFGFEGGFFDAFGTVVKPSQDMNAKFNALTKTHYMRTGDLALSRKRAWTDMAETWSPTSIGAVVTAEGLNRDLRPMEYAPERVMAVSPEVAQQRLEAFARDQKLDAENLIIMSDDTTARDGSWAIWKYDPEADTLEFHPKRWVGIDWAKKAQEHTYNEAVKTAIEARAEEERIDMEMYGLSYGAQIDDQGEEGGQ